MKGGSGNRAALFRGRMERLPVFPGAPGPSAVKEGPKGHKLRLRERSSRPWRRFDPRALEFHHEFDDALWRTLGVHLTMSPTKPDTTRPLAAGEVAMAREVFGDALRYDTVRIWAQPLRRFDRAFVAGRWFGRDWIVWPAASLLPDYSAPEVPLRQASVLIHELVHVWQAQQGLNLLWAKLKAGDGPAAYAYELRDDTLWERLNLEQQAMAVEDEFRRRRSGEVELAAAASALYRRISPFERA